MFLFCFAALVVLTRKCKLPSFRNFLLYPFKSYLYIPILRGENQSKGYKWTSLLACRSATTGKTSLLQGKVNQNEKKNASQIVIEKSSLK